MARSILSLGMLPARLLSRARRRRGFAPGSPPPILAAMVISLLSLAKILLRLASMAPLKCFTFAHLLCPAINLSLRSTFDRPSQPPRPGEGKPVPRVHAKEGNPSEFRVESARATLHTATTGQPDGPEL